VCVCLSMSVSVSVSVSVSMSERERERERERYFIDAEERGGNRGGGQLQQHSHIVPHKVHIAKKSQLTPQVTT